MSWDESGIVFSQGSKGVFRVPAAGGQAEVIVKVGPDEYVEGPQILPGGTTILFTVAKGTTLDRWERAQIVVQPLTPGTRKVVVDRGTDARYLLTGHLVYARGGVLFAAAFDLRRLETVAGAISVVEGVRRSLAGAGVQGNPLLSGAAQFSVSGNGTLTYVPGPVAPLSQPTDLAWVTRDGSVERLKLPPGTYSHVRVSPDGHRLVFANGDGKESNVYSLAPGSGVPVKRLTFVGNNRYPIWSADGKRVAYQSDRENDRGIFSQLADGSAIAERLTKAESGTAHVPESWSPSGDVLLYSVTKDDIATLWAYSLRDGKSTRFDDVSSSTPIGATFSPDGHWVAYGTGGAVFVQPYPPAGPKYQVPYQRREGTGGPHHPFWSRDGRELFYEPTIAQLHAIPVRTQPEFVFGNPMSLAAGAYGSTNPIFYRNRDVGADGKRFITYVSADDAADGPALTEIRVVLNWFEELKARMPSQ